MIFFGFKVDGWKFGCFVFLICLFFGDGWYFKVRRSRMRIIWIAE